MSIKLPEYYFKLGADAMQARIVAILTMKGYMDIAPEILALKTPEYQEPEKVSITSDCDHEWVSADNEHVTGGEICLKCNEIRATPTHKESITPLNDTSK